MKTGWMDDELKKVDAIDSFDDMKKYMGLSWDINIFEHTKLSEREQLIFWKGFMHGYIYLAKEEAVNYDD